MKQFDFKKAKAGAAVCTRDGKPARIICWDEKSDDVNYKYYIIALVDFGLYELAFHYTPSGMVAYGLDLNNNLVMLE